MGKRRRYKIGSQYNYIDFTAAGWAYVLLCFVGTIVVMFKKGDAVIFALGDWTDTISDPVLQPALKLLLIALGVVLLPGIIAILLAFGAFLIAFVIIPVLLYRGAVWLAEVSPASAMIVALGFAVGLTAVVDKNRVAIRKAWMWVQDASIEVLAWGMAFRGSGAERAKMVHVEVIGEKEWEGTVDNGEEKKSDSEQPGEAVEKHFSESLETFIPALPVPGLWARIRNRSVQKDNEEIIKLVGQQKRFVAEARGVVEEKSAYLEAKDNLKRVKRGDIAKTKDEEAEISSLDRKKRKLTLEKEIEEIQKAKSPTPQPAPDRRSPGERKKDAEGKLIEEKKRVLSTYTGDDEGRKRIERHYDDAIARIWNE